MSTFPQSSAVANEVGVDRGRVKVVHRALQLLDLLGAASGQASLQQLTADSALPVGTVHRLLQALVQAGYVRQTDTKIYSLAPQAIWVGGNAGRVLGFWSRPELSRLVQATGETASLAILDGQAATYVGQAPSTHTLRMLTELGLRVPLHSTAAGKALLSALPDDAVSDIIARSGLPKLTGSTITSPSKLAAELELIRRQGYAIELGEHETGVTGVAVAIGKPDLLAAVVSGPSHRLTPEVATGVVPLLHDVCRNLADLSAAGRGAALHGSRRDHE